jgi:hypothetical protein
MKHIDDDQHPQCSNDDFWPFDTVENKKGMSRFRSQGRRLPFPASG